MDETAHAIADPVRRRIVEDLASGELTAGEIAARFDVSRPAISRHLRVLRECGLVSDTVVGRQRVYRVETAPLGEIVSWIAQFDTPPVTAGMLDALDTEVRRTTRARRTHPEPKEATA